MSLCGDNDEDSLMAWKVPSFFIEVKTEDEEGMATQIQFRIERGMRRSRERVSSLRFLDDKKKSVFEHSG